MPAAQTQRKLLEAFNALGREGAGASKDAVLDLLVQVFSVRGAAMTPLKREACLDLLLLVSSLASPEKRVDALERLACLAHTPASRLLAWAAGPIETAEPILRYARRLSSADLVRILLEASPAHLMAAAAREALSESVTDLILLRGEREAIATMLLNRSARLSRPGFNTLAGMALSNRAIRDALIQRSDLPGHVVEKLWPILDLNLKACLVVAGWRYSMAEIEEVNREATASLLQDVRSGSLPRSVDTCCGLIGAGTLTLDAALSEFLKAGRLVEAAQLISRIHGLSEGVALNLLFGSYDRGSALVARHLGLKDDVVLLLACARGRLPWVRSTDIRHALNLTEDCSRKEAETVIAALEKLWAAGVANTGDQRRVPAADERKGRKVA